MASPFLFPTTSACNFLGNSRKLSCTTMSVVLRKLPSLRATSKLCLTAFTALK